MVMPSAIDCHKCLNVKGHLQRKFRKNIALLLRRVHLPVIGSLTFNKGL